MNWQNFKKYFGFFVVGALVIAAILVWTAALAKEQSGLLKVDFFDIGQGKAIFIEAPDGNQILIDGGPDNSVLARLSEVMPYYDRDIDVLILTHPDGDHLNGLVDVLQRYSVGRIIETGVKDSTAEYAAWNKLIEDKKIPVTYALAGENLKVGDNFLLEILFPAQSLVGQDLPSTNAGSIVAKLLYGKNSFLFTGDAEEATETYLTSSGANLDSDILDVGHHGSKNSSSHGFLDAISPQIAVIQVGANNRYGHPTQEALQRLKSVGAKIYRTDQDGNVDFSCDLERCAVETVKN